MYGKRGDRTVLSNEERCDVAAEQTGKGCGKEQAVEAVQHSSVTGENAAEILNTKATFDCGHSKISELAEKRG